MQRETTTESVLGLRLGARSVGMALLEDGELADWGVMGFRRGCADERVEQFGKRLYDLLQRCQPGMVAVEKPSQMRLASSPGLTTMAQEAERVVRLSGLELRSYAPADIRARMCEGCTATMELVVARIVERFPHLGEHRGTGGEWKDVYWEPMFTAVAVALVCAGRAEPTLARQRS